METAASVIKDILHEILIQTSQQLTDSTDSNTVMRYMNRFMASLAVKSPLGYTEVTNLADPITIPSGAIEGLIFNTAVRLLSQYDIIPNQTLFANARDSLSTMVHLASQPILTMRPDTLPIGSGNESSLYQDRYYPSSENTLLDEQGRTILLESDT
ncbi:MAG TPA: hypothetical protein EYN54_14460 [Methylococcaceae bacterium]|nr:hypothetical protein [Methylococcaceae bacterium]